jgi:FHS family glucose/mannose:H+ symporter-like MFS transporter
MDRTGTQLVIAGGLIAFVAFGWTGLLMPALIRDIQADLHANDADMGSAYLVFTVAFLVGCLVTGWSVPRVGRRPILVGGIGLLIVGSLAVMLPSWPVFLGAAVLRGLGSGVVEVGIQGLYLYAFRGPFQTRAITSVHFCYSLGATLAPIALATLLGIEIPWQAAMALIAVPWAVALVLLALAPMDGPARTLGVPPARLRPGVALVAAAIGIALYVACEAGVSSWLVRFLEDAELELAAAALTLFWAAMSVSRLLVARFGSRLPPEGLAIGGLLAAAAALLTAVLVPSVHVSIGMFAIAGFAFGPVFPGVILLGGRIPGRPDAVTSVLASTAVVGSIVYPPLMGVISLGPGLGVAMAGTAVLAAAGAGFVAISARALEPVQATVQA